MPIIGSTPENPLHSESFRTFLISRILNSDDTIGEILDFPDNIIFLVDNMPIKHSSSYKILVEFETRKMGDAPRDYVYYIKIYDEQLFKKIVDYTESWEEYNREDKATIHIDFVDQYRTRFYSGEL